MNIGRGPPCGYRWGGTKRQGPGGPFCAVGTGVGEHSRKTRMRSEAYASRFPVSREPKDWPDLPPWYISGHPGNFPPGTEMQGGILCAVWA